MTQPRSPLAVIARAQQNPFYAKAVGYLDAIALRDKALERQRSIRFPAVTYPEPPTGPDADLDDYLSKFTAARDEEEQRTRDADALSVVIGSCERDINAAAGDPNLLLRALSKDLDQLIGRATPIVDRLDGATTAAEAITAGTADVWRELPPLRREYDQIRHAQELVMLDDPAANHRSDHVDDPLASDALIRNLDTLFPAWREPDNRFTIHGEPPDRRPWPTDPTEQFVWLIRNADMWIPTSHQLVDLQRKRRNRIDPPVDGEPGNLMSTASSHTFLAAAPTRRPAKIIR